MKKFKISQIQFQAMSTPQDNAILLEKLFKKTNKFKPNLICTPECSNIITFDKKYLFSNVNYQNDCPIIKISKKFALKNKVNIHLGSLLLKIKGEKKLANRSILINKKEEIEKIYNKINLFDVNISNIESHRESHSFIKGKKLVVTNIDGIKIGLTICYDLRFPLLYRKLAKKGSQIILIPAAFTVPTGIAHWETLVRARAIENSLFIVATNMCGIHHSGRKTYGHSILIDPWGKIKNKAFKKSKILNSILDIEEINRTRSKIPSIYND